MDKYKHHQQHFDLHKFLHNKYNDLLISNTLRNFALSLISLFLPIFLLELGYNILTVMILEILMLLTSLLIHFASVPLIKSIGIKKTLVISYATTIIFYITLYNAEAIIQKNTGLFFLIVMGFINVTFTTLFWMAHHLHFIKVTKSKNSGKRYGLLLAIPTMLSVVSPLVGSVLITQYGFKQAFLVSTVLMVLSCITLFFSDEVTIKHKAINYKRVWQGAGAIYNGMFFIEGFSIIATGFVWPIMLYFLGKQLITLGVLYLFSNITYALISYYSGKLVDKKGSSLLLKIGTIGHALSVILRAFSKTIIFMTGFQSMGAFFGALWDISFTSNFYKKSHRHPVDSVLNREVYLHAGRVCMFSIVILIFLITNNILHTLFIALVISGLLTFSFSLVIRNQKID